MKVSIIIPTLNEAGCISRTLEAVRSLTGLFEVVVADGGSTDGTLQKVHDTGVTVVTAARGRGTQMNAGASIAAGDVLLFLHADTLLPPNTYPLICNALNNPSVAGGCFRLRFDHDRGLLRLCSVLTQFPLPLLHYGDSGYFVRKDVFERLGGYAELPFMEDIEFWRRMTKSHHHVVLPEAVVTSARRFRRDGVLTRQLINTLLVLLFLLGVSPERLVRFYERRSFAGGVMARLGVRVRSGWDACWYPVRTLWHWTYSNMHLIGQTYYVLDFMKWHALHAHAVPPSHPWVTGLMPQTQEPVWDKNIVFASPRKSCWNALPETDAEIAVSIGRFLSVMVKHSVVPDPELPQGSKRRMPHGVNYIHGSIHYNGGLVIFNDFRDGMRYLSDPKFIREMKRFARHERRELTIVLRERDYDPEEFAWFVTFVRAHMPWFANGNGPTRKRVLFGTPSPYAAVNPINGSWVRDLQRLYRGELDAIVRPPVSERYFTGMYHGKQTEYTFLERFHAWAQHLQITAKGFQGGLVFTSRKKIEPENYRRYVETSGQWRASYRVSHPFAPIERVRQARGHALS